MIPKKIVQYWSDSFIPSEVSSLMNTWVDNNADYEYEIFDFFRAKSFIAQHYGKQVENVFSGLNFPSMQADVFRLAYLNIYGGVYVDSGSYCKASIKGMIDPERVSVIRKWHGNICNGFISSPLGSDYIKELWDSALVNIKSRQDGDIWSLTGPKLFIDHFDDNLCSAVDQKQAEEYFSFVNNLNYKAMHWSKLQKILPLHDFNYSKLITQSLSSEEISALSKKVLIIHLGQHKTDSTAIQRELIKLSHDGDFLYPNVGKLYSGHHGLAASLGKDSHVWCPIIKELAKEISCNKTEKVVISSEFFSSLNELTYNKKINSQVLGVLGGFASLFKNSNIIYYVRDQVTAIESRINQAIKSRVCLSEVKVKRMIDNNPTLDYSVFHQALKQLFPCSTISAIVYDKKLMYSEDIRIDFLQRSCIDGKVSISNAITCEKIKSSAALASCYLINSAKISVDEKMRLKAVAINKLVSDKDGCVLTESDIKHIHSYYEKSNDFFLKKIISTESYTWDLPEAFQDSFISLIDSNFLILDLIDKIDSGSDSKA